MYSFIFFNFLFCSSGETLENAAKEEAEEYGAELNNVEFNGIPFVTYTAQEEIEGKTYSTLTSLAEDGDYIVEIVFWLDGEDAAAVAESILSTITK